LRSIARKKRIEAEHAHLERLRPFRDGLPDPAQADDAERLAGQLVAMNLFRSQRCSSRL